MTATEHRVRPALNPFRPQAFFVERERVESGEIVSVIALFLTNRECPWRCVYCDLWKNTTIETVPVGAIPEQIDFALGKLDARLCSQIKLYNSGSFFDPSAIPLKDFPAIAARARQFERVIVECHPALVDDSALHFRDLLGTGTKLEVAMGLEIADDAVLARLNKRMTLAMFERAAKFLIEHGIDVRAFIIVKPPFVRTDAEAVAMAQRSSQFAFDCGVTVVSLIPARFAAAELDELARSGDFAPPSLAALEESHEAGIALERGRVFVDLWDVEKLAGCCRCLPDRVARLREMNFQQTALPRIRCSHEATVCVARG
jgi:archaeosine synthase beta-subunit